MENIPCQECGALTNGYCHNCGNVTAQVHQFRGTPSIVKELQSLCLGLAQLCERPTTSVSDVISGIKEMKSCQFCHGLFDVSKDVDGSPFCCIECRASSDDAMIEQDQEGLDLNLQF